MQLVAESISRRCASSGRPPPTSCKMKLALLFSWTLLCNVWPPVTAQSSNVVCLPSFDWAFNSLNQNPCLVGAYLESVCNPGFSVPALPPANHYFGPPAGGGNDCACNTVVYSLISACGACQNRTFADWEAWIANCPSTNTSIASFPKGVPSGTAVPAWAFANITASNNTFNLAVAQAIGRNPETTGDSKPTAASSPSSAISQTTIAGSASSQPSSVPASSSVASSAILTSRTNPGAIAGGVVGGLAFLAVIAVVVWLFLTRRKNKIHSGDFTMAHPVLLDSPGPTSMKEMFVSPRPGIPVIQVSSPEPPTLSDSSNLTSSTPAPSTIHTTYDAPNHAPGIITSRGYSGAPEIC